MKVRSKERETKSLFWKAINSQVTKEVVKLNIEKDQLNADLIAFGKLKTNKKSNNLKISGENHVRG